MLEGTSVYTGGVQLFCAAYLIKHGLFWAEFHMELLPVMVKILL